MTEQEYISRQKMISELRGGFFPQDVVYTEAVAIAKQIIESAPAEDVVSRGVFEQVKWERDMAMQQLEEHGIPFCGKADDVVKVVRCKVGDVVYDYAGRECIVVSIHFYNSGLPTFTTVRDGYHGVKIHTSYVFDDIGETVFFSREEVKN